MIAALMYADDLEVIAGDEEMFKRRLKVVYDWTKKWRMKVNEKKSEVVVFGRKGIVKERGWLLGGKRLKEKEEAVCLGIVFEKGGRREATLRKRMGKIGMVMASLKETRKVLGERAAWLAWKVFGRTVLLFGTDVMVWDRVGGNRKMDVCERKAMRMVLGLDKGGNDQLIYGEMKGNKLSVDVEASAVRYGEKVRKLGDEDVRKRMWIERFASGKDRWAKYWERSQESMEGIGMYNEAGTERSWSDRVNEREDRIWMEAMRKSKSSLEVHREVVEARCEQIDFMVKRGLWEVRRREFGG